MSSPEAVRYVWPPENRECDSIEHTIGPNLPACRWPACSPPSLPPWLSMGRRSLVSEGLAYMLSVDAESKVGWRWAAVGHAHAPAFSQTACLLQSPCSVLICACRLCYRGHHPGALWQRERPGHCGRPGPGESAHHHSAVQCDNPWWSIPTHPTGTQMVYTWPTWLHTQTLHPHSLTLLKAPHSLTPSPSHRQLDYVKPTWNEAAEGPLFIAYINSGGLRADLPKVRSRGKSVGKCEEGEGMCERTDGRICPGWGQWE